MLRTIILSIILSFIAQMAIANDRIANARDEIKSDTIRVLRKTRSAKVVAQWGISLGLINSNAKVSDSDAGRGYLRPGNKYKGLYPSLGIVGMFKSSQSTSGFGAMTGLIYMKQKLVLEVGANESVIELSTLSIPAGLTYDFYQVDGLKLYSLIGVAGDIHISAKSFVRSSNTSTTRGVFDPKSFQAGPFIGFGVQKKMKKILGAVQLRYDYRSSLNKSTNFRLNQQKLELSIIVSKAK